MCSASKTFNLLVDVRAKSGRDFSPILAPTPRSVNERWRKSRADLRRGPTRTWAVVLHAFVKVPDKLSEVLGDVLELCGGGGSGGATSGDKGMSGNASSAATKIGAVTGVAIIRGRWAQRGARPHLSSVANTDSADSTTSTSSEVQWLHPRTERKKCQTYMSRFNFKYKAPSFSPFYSIFLIILFWKK